MSRSRSALLAALLALSPAAGRADLLPPLTQEQSSSLARTLRLWSRGLIGDLSGVAATPADGYYDVRVPITADVAGLSMRIEGGPITARATLDPQGVWHFEQLHYPTPLHTRATPPGGETVATTQTIRDQDGGAVIDPSLATASHWEQTLQGLEQRSEGDAPTVTTFDRVATREEWVPAGPGRVDTALVSRIDTTAVHAQLPADPDGGGARAVDVGTRQSTLTVQSQGADLDRLSGFIQNAIAFLRSVRLREQDELTADQKSTLHAMAQQSRDLASNLKFAVAAAGMAVTYAGQHVTLDRFSLDQSLAAPDGKPDLRLRLELAGLGWPGRLPPTARELIPKKLVLAPYASGGTVDDIYALLDRAIDAGPETTGLGEDALARLARAPVTAGIDELSFDLGPAAVSAHGSLVASGPDDATGSAVIEASGLDALIRKANADPLLKKAAPMLIFLKGIGEQDGGRTVWNVAYKDGAMTVNGTDLSGLMPGR